MVDPPPRPEFFKYTSAATAKLILGNRSVRYAAPHTLNDPNDCQLDLDWGFTEEEARAEATKRFLAIGNSPTRPPYERWTRYTMVLEAFRLARRHIPKTDEQIAQTLAPALIKGWADMKDVQPVFNAGLRAAWLEKARVFCVSEIADQPLMWTHYGDQHKGVALRFVFPDEVDNVLRIAKPVIYREQPPALATLDEFMDVHFLGKRFDQELIWERLFRTKSAQYAYEREWRVLLPVDAPDQEYYYLNIDPREVEAVIIGARTPATEIAELLAIVRDGYPHARVLQAKLNGYNVSIEAFADPATEHAEA